MKDVLIASLAIVFVIGILLMAPIFFPALIVRNFFSKKDPDELFNCELLT